MVEHLRAAAEESRRTAMALQPIVERERRREAEEAAQQISHLRASLILEMTEDEFEGRAVLRPEIAEVWEEYFPDRPIIDGHLATGAQMARLQEQKERRETVEWLVSQGRTAQEARAMVAADYGDSVAEATVSTSAAAYSDAAEKSEAITRAAMAAMAAMAAGFPGAVPPPAAQQAAESRSDIDYAELLRECGFTAEAAHHGARQVAFEQRTGRYVGFRTNVALLKFSRGYTTSIRPHLTEAVIERVEAMENAARGAAGSSSAADLSLCESAATLDPAAVTAAAGTPVPIVILTPGWGSSGYYSLRVLEDAARDQVIPAGTHMYCDHPSALQQQDRPERSVRDLVGVLTEDAQWNGSALVSKAQFFPPYDTQFREMADAIGLSIRGSATDITQGTAEGRTGPIIEGLAHVASVDVVTRAGRGGRILSSGDLA